MHDPSDRGFLFFSPHASDFLLTMFLKTSDESNTFLHKNKSHTTMKHKSSILCNTQLPRSNTVNSLAYIVSNLFYFYSYSNAQMGASYFI